MAMNIRIRMVPPAPLVTIALLIVTAIIHALWAMGSTWPRGTPEELADLVVGRRPMPGAGASWVVTALVVAGVVLVAAAGGALPTVARRFPRIIGVGAAGVAGVLALRGFGGLVVSAAKLTSETEEFRKMNLRFYSPLCLLLATGAADATFRHITRRDT